MYDELSNPFSTEMSPQKSVSIGQWLGNMYYMDWIKFVDNSNTIRIQGLFSVYPYKPLCILMTLLIAAITGLGCKKIRWVFPVCAINHETVQWGSRDTYIDTGTRLVTTLNRIDP